MKPVYSKPTLTSFRMANVDAADAVCSMGSLVGANATYCGGGKTPDTTSNCKTGSAATGVDPGTVCSNGKKAGGGCLNGNKYV